MGYVLGVGKAGKTLVKSETLLIAQIRLVEDHEYCNLPLRTHEVCGQNIGLSVSR
jgi:hypothetical protein